MPRSRIVRLAIGIGLIVGGTLGFLPVLGFWMIPLGLLVLSIDLAIVRRARRRMEVAWYRRTNGNGRRGNGSSAGAAPEAPAKTGDWQNSE